MGSVCRNFRFWLIALAMVVLFVKCHTDVSQKQWDINQGYVPDSTTAVQVAQIIFVRVYGEKVFKKRPFTAILKKGIWIVDGSLDKGTDGGVPHIEIQKSDGKIIYLTHGK